jgi:putative ABC transport system ATP-binding protein
MLQAVNITKVYQGGNKPAVDRASLKIGRGEFVSILGRSGSGKSTLLNMLSSLVLPDSGQLFYAGEDICAYREQERNRLRRAEFAVIFQQHHLMPYLTAMENVLLPFIGGARRVTAEERRVGREMLWRVGLNGKENSRPGNLSGGEQQRVAIARALSKGARVLFADEPTGSLDSATGAAIMELLQLLNKDGLTVVMVTHNDDYARLADRSIVMVDGQVR